MFENLRQAFREAVENFKEELSRDEIPEAVDRLLAGMQEEVTDAQAYLRHLEDDAEKALAGAEAEKQEARTCRRREKLAQEIDDEDTARVAREFAEKHEKRQAVLEAKARALTEEAKVREGEIREMLARIKEAREQRDSLAAAAGRSQARSSLREGEDLFDELDRMADRISDDERRAGAARDLDDDLGLGGSAGSDVPPAQDVETRLRELKRRMGRED